MRAHRSSRLMAAVLGVVLAWFVAAAASAGGGAAAAPRAGDELSGAGRSVPVAMRFRVGRKW